MNQTTRVFVISLLAVVLGVSARALSPDPEKTRQLLGVVRSDAELALRAQALQQLALIASKEAVPVVAGLLGDEKLGHYARDVLEGMPDPAAGDALREALPKLRGHALIGVVNSVGLRRDPNAVHALARLAAETNSDAAPAALLALGRIGTPEAERVVRKALTSGADHLQPAAAEAALLMAERLLRNRDNDAARVLFDEVRGMHLPQPLRLSAMRGAILARGAGGVQLLIEQLHASERAMRDLALRVIRELPGPTVTPALFAEFERLESSLRARVVTALADRAEPEMLALFEERAATAAPAVRTEALKALGRIGLNSSLPILLQAAVASDAEVSAAALSSLSRIDAPETNAALRTALVNGEREMQLKLIPVLGERQAENAKSDLLALAAARDVELSKAALRALGLVCRPADLPQLIRLSLAAEGEDVKTLADRAIVATAMKVAKPQRPVDPLLKAFREAPNASAKSALVRPLGAVVRSLGGSHEVFLALREALHDRALVVRQAALNCLADWPNATPTTTLLNVVNRKDADAREREVALRGAVRMATQVAAGRERSPLNVLDVFVRANAHVRGRDQKLMIVSGLGHLRRAEVLDLLRPYVADPDVQTEAALAVVQVAPALLGTSSRAAVRALLEQIAAGEKDEAVRSRAAQLMQGGAALAVAPKGKGKAAQRGAARPTASEASGALFNGTDLSGWDGDPAVWRVRDGVIVGGWMQGNPRNEFLATTRSFQNFVLRLDYKLVGTEGFVNGGVQVRSVRITEPPNEMRGYQADIGAGHSGSLYDESRRKVFLARAPQEQVARLEKPGEWNHYEIRCEGTRVELFLNGEKTLSYTETDPTIPQVGLVALQIHGNCKAEISFRNIVVEELPSSGRGASSQ